MELAEWQAAGKRYDHRGRRIFYRREGKGPVVVLIHGFPTASWDWQRIWPDLTRDFDVVAPDLIGFGFSDKPRGYDYSLLDQATLVEGLLADLSIGEAHLVAHDYGVSVAQELLARHREHASDPSFAKASEGKGATGLALLSVHFLNGGLFPGVHRPLLIQNLLMSPLGPLLSRVLRRSSLARSFRKIFGPHTQPTDTEIDDFWRLIQHNDGQRVIHRLIRYMAERRAYGDRWVGVLGSTAVPLRLTCGLFDPLSGGHVAEHYRKTVPGAYVVSLNDIGHYPQVEAPDSVVRSFREFIRQLP